MVKRNKFGASATYQGETSAASVYAATEFSVCTPENAELSPTTEAMLYWVSVYKIMNRCLFDGQLPNCMITLERRGRAFGYFRPNSFKNREGEVAHQIAMNPECFEPYGDLEAFQTLAHEMCHLWRELFGPRNKNGCTGTRGYHCGVWGGKMESIGLMPSNTGKPGGKKTGYQMMDYVIEAGKFDLLSRELLEKGMHIEWRDAAPQFSSPAQGEEIPELEGMLLMPEGGVVSSQQKPAPKRNSRAKFVCPECDLKAYAKPGARLVCGDCNIRMKRDFGGAA
jgi:hypothetical protein